MAFRYPGLGDGDDTDDEAVRKKRLQAIGRRLRSVFGEKDRVEIDGSVIRKFVMERPDEPERCAKTYQFENGVSEEEVPF